jgi:deoxyribodipyrimidine photo-lyase
LTCWKHGKAVLEKGGILHEDRVFENDIEKFNGWIHGKTEDDFVNANMIELAQTGFMSNRGRQNVASYLVHDLKIDWRWGAAYFESQLIDYDFSNNWGNWMYVAGVGNDPRSRRFNTKLQAERYDPELSIQKYVASRPNQYSEVINSRHLASAKTVHLQM